jgi:hypothetical protein
VALADPAPGSLTWFVIVAADGASGSLLGYDAEGAARGGSGNGFCGLAQQDADARCP